MNEPNKSCAVKSLRNEGKPWREADERLLKKLMRLRTFRTYLPLRTIAFKLGRSEAEVRKHL